MFNKGFSGIVLVIILAVFLAGGGAAWYWQSRPAVTPPVVPAPAAQPLIAPPSTPADPTANWKTYRNEEYGFEFRYPPNVHVGQPAASSVLSKGNNKIGGIYVGSIVFVIANTPESRLEADAYIKDLEEVAKDKPIAKPGEPGIACESEQLKENIRYVICRLPTVYHALIKGDQIDIFVDPYSRGWPTGPGRPDFGPQVSIEELKQLLATFRFIR